MSGLELLAPLGLAALIGLPIVIVLHMRNTSPVRRPVPTLRFWLAAMHEQVERSSFRRPPLSLLLLLHLLIVALLAFALTRPATSRAWVGLGLRTEPQHLIILLDGSTSMSALDTPSGRTRFEDARARALDEVGDLREGDVATLILLGTHTSTFEATDAGTLKALRDRIAGLDPPGGRADLDAALQLAKDLLLPNLEDRIVLISDGAVSADPAVVTGLGAPIDLIRVGGDATDNIAVTEIAARATPEHPDQQQLYARVANFGAAQVTVPVALIVDNIEFTRQDVVLPPAGGSEPLAWPLPAGASSVTVSVPVEDALPADNAASLILQQESDLTLKILLVSDSPALYVQRALTSLAGAEVTIERTDSPALKDLQEPYDLVVYENSAPPVESLPDAALLFVHPPETGGPFATSGPMPTPTVVRVRAYDPLLNGVDLGGVTFGQTPAYVLDANFTEVVGAENGPLIFRGMLHDHPTVVLAFDVTLSNIVNRPPFPILIANIARELAPSPLPAAVSLGDPLVYRPRAEAATVRIVPPGGDPVDLAVAAAGAAATDPAAAGAAASPSSERLREVSFTDTGQSGIYQVVELDATGAELGGGRVVVNAGHSRESDLRPNPDLAATLGLAHATGDQSSETRLSDLWPPLLVAALAVLGAEWLFALIPRRRFGSRLPLRRARG